MEKMIRSIRKFDKINLVNEEVSNEAYQQMLDQLTKELISEYFTENNFDEKEYRMDLFNQEDSTEVTQAFTGDSATDKQLEVRVKVQELLEEKLKKFQIDIYNCFHRKGMSYNQIIDETNKSFNQIDKTLRRAKKLITDMADNLGE